LVATAALTGALAGCKHAVSCPPGQLAAADLDLRNKLHYTEHSPEPEKFCNACQQYTHEGDNDCGGCKLIKGPINPAGYCIAFAAKG
jgi:hypothetical protein